MKVQLAQKLYHGQQGYNCAQAILKAFQKEFNIDSQTINAAKENGRGKAKGGVCGALFAARQLMKDDDLIMNINHDFELKGGNVRCIQIRKNKNLSCKECVKLAAENVQKMI